MVKLNIWGDFFSSTGYGSHTWQLFKALHEEGVELSCETPLSADWEKKIPDKYHSCFKEVHPRWPTLMINLPHTWRLKLADHPEKFLGFFVWESLTVPKYFIDCIDDIRVTKILIPSFFVGNSIYNLPYPINEDKEYQVVPHGVDNTLFTPRTEPFDKEHKFTFLFSKGWNGSKDDRNGIAPLIQAWCEEFKREEPVRLLLKINPAYAPVGFNFLAHFQAMFPEARQSAEIAIIFDNIPYEEQTRIYHEGNVFVFPSLGEAFGMTALEAMSCGLPVIATGIGGHTDFVNIENGWLLDYEKIPAPASAGLLYEGTEWYTPKISELKRAMREAYTNQEGLKEKGLLARKKAEEFTWKKSAQKIINLLDKKE